MKNYWAKIVVKVMKQGIRTKLSTTTKANSFIVVYNKLRKENVYVISQLPESRSQNNHRYRKNIDTEKRTFYAD